MSTYLFAVPILPGKTENLKTYIREMNGPRRDEYRSTNQRAGLEVEQLWLEQTPQGDMLLVRWETDDPVRIFEMGMKSTEPFDTWFRDKIIIECLGIDPSGPMPQLNELLSNYQGVRAGVIKGDRTYQESRKK